MGDLQPCMRGVDFLWSHIPRKHGQDPFDLSTTTTVLYFCPSIVAFESKFTVSVKKKPKITNSRGEKASGRQGRVKMRRVKTQGGVDRVG